MNRLPIMTILATLAVAPLAHAQTAAAGINLRTAIENAERLGPGTAIEADLKDKHGVRRYEITLRSADKGVEKLLLDANSGQLLERRAKHDKSWLGSAALPAGEKPILAAIAAAEKQGGVAIEAERKDKYGRVYYEVELQQGLWKREVRIDATTGESLPAR